MNQSCGSEGLVISDYLVHRKEEMKGGCDKSFQTSVLGLVLYSRIINYLKIITLTADNFWIIVSIVKRKVGNEELDDSS